MSSKVCPRCAAPAEYRLGELHCPVCGHIEKLVIDTARPDRRPTRSAAVQQPLRAAAGDDPLVRRSDPDSMPGQLWKLKGGRSMRPSLGYSGSGPSVTEIGAFLSCFFLSGVLFSGLMSTITGGASLLGGIIWSGFLTLFLAFILSQKMPQFQGLILLAAFALTLAWIYILWKSILTGAWQGIAISLGGLAISGWLFSLLYRQNIYEGM